MTKPFQISAKAALSLVGIAAWTDENFGPYQADRYIDLLIARVNALCVGTAQHDGCREKFAPALRADLRYARAERHFIIFVETPETILVIDFLHQSADIAHHLQGQNP